MNRIISVLVLMLAICLVFASCSLIGGANDDGNKQENVSDVIGDVENGDSTGDGMGGDGSSDTDKEPDDTDICDHVWEELRVEANCTEGGLVERVCAKCGERVVDLTTQPIGHSYNALFFYDAENHWKECQVCGEKQGTESHVHDGHGLCSICGAAFMASEGLMYEVLENPDGSKYADVCGYNGTETTVYIPESYNGLPVSSISFFGYDNTTVNEVVIPDSITYVYNGAFDYCENIQYNLYENCKYLGNKRNPYLVMTAITGDSFDSYELHPDTEIIVPGAFSYCYNLTSLKIPAKVRTIGSYLISGAMNLKSIDVDPENQYYKSVDGTLYTKNGDTLIQYCPAKEDREFTIPDGVKTIADAAFFECGRLFSVSIPESLEIIGSSAFAYCYMLTEISLPEGIKVIGDSAFYNCMDLEAVNLPDGLEHIGYGAFDGCSRLSNVYLPEGLITIGNYAFDGCENISYTEYENGKYMGSRSNPYFMLVEVIDKEVDSFDIHSDTRIIGPYAFENCASISSIVIPKGVVSICESAFLLSNVEKIYIPDSVKNIEEDSFSFCFTLSEIYFGGSADQWNSFGNIQFDTEVTICFGYKYE